MSNAKLPEGFTIERDLVGHTYPKNGNLGKPSPRYTFRLLLDGKLVDRDNRHKNLVLAAINYGRKGYEK